MNDDDEWDDDNWPDWRDLDRFVEFELADGSRRTGKLSLKDMAEDLEGNEIPLFFIAVGSLEYEFTEAKHWRFIDLIDRQPGQHGEKA